MTNKGQDVTETYNAQGYAAVRQVIPPEVAAVFLSITQKAMGDTRESQARFNSAAQPLNKPAYDVYSYDYPAAMTLLWGLTPFMEGATGKALLPTYSFFRVYPKGGVCKVHSDRPSCEHSMSLTLGSSDGLIWPFAIGRRRLTDDDLGDRARGIEPDFGKDEYSTVNMKPGDAVLYQGVHYRHGRLDPNPNRWSAHIFLHWIDRNGPYKDHAFDKRALPGAAEFRF
ncbi:MAG: hypothetical protein KIS81_01170 [Maricaulaceae bacterium]|nr:hypothetical protein [Maricaulaceae bacterium]